MKLSAYFFLFLLICSCKPSFDEPIISLEDYKVEEGFELQMVASEPLLVAPVAMDFDSKGRIWVAEMPGFMNNIDGTGEELPTGSIKILEDLDNDGRMDHAKIFLDSLVMPRALAHVYGGLLYAEPPYLRFVEIENDRPVNSIVVDSLYAADGNPEHQPNGLMMNVDNWIYNAKSHFRYQRKDGQWIKEPTTFRGQWGISHDDFGRLYYNDNSRQLLGDYMLPNRLIRNQYHIPTVGLGHMLTKDQRVYPLHAASVNRGYEKGILDKDSLLVNVTAACGPLVYRGGQFPSGYDQNVFVCAPEANLIKRNILSFNGDHIAAEQAWQGKEFVASYDEGFRPVNLTNGPDGSMYIVDMHRGVIGHHAYLSPYLKEKSLEKQLDTIIDFGRILKVKKQGAETTKLRDFDKLSGSELLALLKDKNGWIRDRAQHYLIFKNKTEVIADLEKLVLDPMLPLAQIHALYTLQGLEALKLPTLIEVAKNSDADVSAHALVLLEDFASPENVAVAKNLFIDVLKRKDLALDLYLSSSIGLWAEVSQEEFFPIVYELSNSYKEHKIIQDALISGMSGTASDLQLAIENGADLLQDNIKTLLAKSLDRKEQQKPNSIFVRKSLSEDTRTKGAKLFRQICASCHGAGGEGMDGLAPPLLNSEYVANHMERLGLIILHGLKGPVTVNGEVYEYNHTMPGLASNEAISDKDITDIISYITNAFSAVPSQLAPEKVKELRGKKPKEGMEYTEGELLEYVKQLQ
ncbi:c-type cytochrome [Arenibacter sp. 6A1]|uniref:DUF7133 domain-containing protein n=1 Tax=Arenibacter sp. 6A1 TaxID=2720391 RepID=UPI001444DC1E|nr:c-type cytochrome [Arenibacter sp. 6A1]NKI25335.1 c-type cytochrome [Arenibacter sp. 6A1]